MVPVHAPNRKISQLGTANPVRIARCLYLGKASLARLLASLVLLCRHESRRRSLIFPEDLRHNPGRFAAVKPVCMPVANKNGEVSRLCFFDHDT